MRDKIVTAGKPAQIKLVANKTILKADDKDVAVVRVLVLDKKGNFVPLANNQLDFEIIGNAKILGTGNGDPSSDEVDSKPSRKAFNGKAVVLIQAGKQGGKFSLIAKSKLISDAQIEFTLE